MKQITSILNRGGYFTALLILILGFVWGMSIPQMAQAETTDGTPIYEAADLLKMKSSYGSFYLANDIDMEPYGNWESISFYGVLDGKGHVIKNLTITNSEGFFGYLRGTVKNLGFENVMVSIDKANCGILASEAKDSKIDGCFVQGLIQQKSKSAYGYTGGIISGSTNCDVTNCYNACTIKKDMINEDWGSVYSEIGGIVGKCSGGNVTNCYNIGMIEATNSEKLHRVGGIVGWLGDGASLKYCYNIGDVSSMSGKSVHIGGLVGCLSNAQVYQSYNAGMVNSDSSEGRSGSLIGYVTHDASIAQLYRLQGTNKDSINRADEDAELFDGKYKILSQTEMQRKESFAGWDFDTIWTIDATKNNGMPIHLSMAPKAVKPVADIASGQYDSQIKVQLTSDTPNAVIYYTLDGSKPSTKSYVYTGEPLAISETTVLKAIATAPGYKNSGVRRYKYSFRIAKVQASVPSGKIQKKFNLKLSSDTPGATIYYTLDGSLPTTASKKYTGSIKITRSTVVRAIAVKGNSQSKAVKFTYRLK